MKKKSFEKGCIGCDHLKWYEAYFEEPEDSGYYCDVRVIPSKSFPLKRKCSLWEKTVIKDDGTEVVMRYVSQRESKNGIPHYKEVER